MEFLSYYSCKLHHILLRKKIVQSFWNDQGQQPAHLPFLLPLLVIKAYLKINEIECKDFLIKFIFKLNSILFEINLYSLNKLKSKFLRIKKWKRKQLADKFLIWLICWIYEIDWIHWLEQFRSRLKLFLSLFALSNASLVTNSLFIAYNAWNVKVPGYSWNSM